MASSTVGAVSPRSAAIPWPERGGDAAASEPLAPRLAVLVPCYNEEQGLTATVETILRGLEQSQPSGGERGAAAFEVRIVDDGSTDGSPAVIEELTRRWPCVRALRHERNEGYGAALKTALLSTRSELVAMTDADGSYPSDRIGELVRALEHCDMAVGARAPNDPHYPVLRRVPKAVLTWWVAWLVGRRIPDINSGLRSFRRDAAVRFVPLLPDGFSFTTTITIAMLRSGYRVRWLPIATAPRRGRSKIRPLRDSAAFVQLLLRVGVYFAPLRMLAPLVATAGLATLASAVYDIWVLRNLTDKTLILFVLTTTTALFALLADMLDKRTR